MTISTRPANPDDVFPISKLFAASWKYAYADIVNSGYLNSLPDEHWVSFLETGMAEHKLISMLAEEDGKLIGAAVMRQSLLEQFPHDGELVCFYLLPDQIGKGIGHILLMAIEDLLRENAYTHCVLDVLTENKSAKIFYKKHGFAQTDFILKTQLGNQELKCNIMRKALVDIEQA